MQHMKKLPQLQLLDTSQASVNRHLISVIRATLLQGGFLKVWLPHGALPARFMRSDAICFMALILVAETARVRVQFCPRVSARAAAGDRDIP